MAIYKQLLFQRKPAAVTPAKVFQIRDSETLWITIETINIANITGSDATYKLWMVNNAETSPADNNILWPTVTQTANSFSIIRCCYHFSTTNEILYFQSDTADAFVITGFGEINAPRKAVSFQ